MAICWERAVPLAFHSCCFYFNAVLILGDPFPFSVEGRMLNSIVSVPDHCLFIYNYNWFIDSGLQPISSKHTNNRLIICTDAPTMVDRSCSYAEMKMYEQSNIP